MYRNLFGAYAPTHAGVVPKGHLDARYTIFTLGSELLPYADSSGLSVKIATGVAFCQGVIYFQDEITSVALEEADSTNPRIDVVVLRYDFTTETASIVVVEGTAAASPSIPAITKTGDEYDILLGYIYVGAGVTTLDAEDVYDVRQFCTMLRNISMEIACDVGDGAGEMLVVDSMIVPEAMQITRVDIVANTSGSLKVETYVADLTTKVKRSIAEINLSSQQRYYTHRGFSDTDVSTLSGETTVLTSDGFYVLFNESELVDIETFTLNVEYYSLGEDV
jgi:hypothetical protein